VNIATGGGRRIVEVTGVDVARVRGLYPTLASGTVQLDGGFAALQPESVIRAITTALRSAPAQPGSRSTRSQRSVTRVRLARTAAADLVAGQPNDVLLGDSAASLLWRFIAVLSTDWVLGDEIVLSRLDSDLTTRSWQYAARRRGVVVRFAEVDVETGELPPWQYEDLVNARTRIVTVSLGNPATGMIPDVAAIADHAHRHGALVVADAGVAAAYRVLDLFELEVDLLFVSAEVFGGPLMSVAVGRPGLLGEITNGDDPIVRHSLDFLPLPIELLDGFTASVDHLADLDESAAGTRRERLARSLPAANAYCCGLYGHLDDELRAMPHVAVLGGPDRDLPVAAFTVEGLEPDEVGAHLHRRDISAWTGPSGVSELLRTFGADELGGAVFVGVMPHTTPTEIAQLLDAVRELKH
jgi:selenocysteine lyase/cysteine desulfurase